MGEGLKQIKKKIEKDHQVSGTATTTTSGSSIHWICSLGPDSRGAATVSSRTQGVCCDVEVFQSIFYNTVDDGIRLFYIWPGIAQVQVSAGTRYKILFYNPEKSGKNLETKFTAGSKISKSLNIFYNWRGWDGVVEFATSAGSGSEVPYGEVLICTATWGEPIGCTGSPRPAVVQFLRGLP